MMHASVFVRDQTYRTENFQTCPEDRPLIAQFCTDDPDTFVAASKLIENKCDAIDLKLGDNFSKTFKPNTKNEKFD